ncbi:hypothetical protein E2562_039429 [Oryza meyeriana var. granulata]|uniref:Uncharacterized protein n=1 Tax=Oryza meyeriana var. granulata TaxID=110450 RepID=A0A6G1EUJ2_9ORYZ|nr:hypothetical protein E2562_039429 [Oryza meyeriana var. granulata]
MTPPLPPIQSPSAGSRRSGDLPAEPSPPALPVPADCQSSAAEFLHGHLPPLRYIDAGQPPPSAFHASPPESTAHQ